jgi:hypothetical protein
MRSKATLLLVALLLCTTGCGKGCEGRKKSYESESESSSGSSKAAYKVEKAKYKLTKLASNTVEPSKEATVKYENKVSVTVPAGTLGEKRELVISSVEDSPAPTMAGLKHLAVYDVSLGRPQELKNDIKLELACPEVKGAPQLVWLEYWDEVQQAWCALPSEYDSQKKVVRAATNHLCPVAIASAEQISETTGKPVYPADKGKWYYADEYFVMSFIKTEIEASTCDKKEPKGFKAFQDPSVPVYHEDMPRFVEDIWFYLTEAYCKYCGTGGAGFRDLVKFDESAYIFKGGTKVFVGGGGSSSRNKFTGNISMTISTNNYGALRMEVAHELFHCVQNRYYNCAGMTMRKWWMECTADYAAEKVACAGVNRMGGEKIHPRFYEKCLTYASSVIYDAASGLEEGAREIVGFKPDKFLADDPHGYHEYTAAFFIQFLVDKKGINFKDMFDEVAKSYNPVITTPIDAYLRTKGTSLEQAYHEFVHWWIFCSDGILRGRLKVGDLFTSAAEPNLSTMLDSETGTLPAILALDYGHSAKVWPFRVEMRKTSDGDADRSRKVRIELTGMDKPGPEDSDVAWYPFVKADVYVLANGNPDDGGGSPAISIDPSSGKPEAARAEVEVFENDVIYVVAYNTNLTQANRIIVDAVSPVLRIVRPVAKGTEAVAGTKYTWTVKKEKSGIPKDAVYKWDFGGDEKDDGNKAEGEKVEHVFPDEGTFTVKCKAEWKEGEKECSVEDETKVKVKPGEQLAFPAVGLGLNLPYKYSVSGTINNNGDNFDDTIKYELEDEKAVWKGMTYRYTKPLEELSGTPIGTNPADPDSGTGSGLTSRKTGSEDYIITVDAKAETLISLEFSAKVDTPERIVRNKFVFTNVPRLATIDLGPNAGLIYVFGLKGEEMKKYSTTCEAGGEGDSVEWDPDTKESVKVRGKSRLTSAVWKDSYVMVTLSTITMAELRARAEKGTIDRKKVEDAFDKQLGPIMEKLKYGK